jgi:hypothetical protein
MNDLNFRIICKIIGDFEVVEKGIGEVDFIIDSDVAEEDLDLLSDYLANTYSIIYKINIVKKKGGIDDNNR